MRIFLVALLAFGVARGAPNVLPAPLGQVLDSASSVVLYSLEPIMQQPGMRDQLDGFDILGKVNLDREETKICVATFEKAIADSNGQAMDCFDPRHALRVFSDGHNYDFLLCYACDHLAVYRDGRDVGGVSVAGSPGALNHLLKKHHLPISHSRGSR